MNKIFGASVLTLACLLGACAGALDNPGRFGTGGAAGAAGSAGMVAAGGAGGAGGVMMMGAGGSGGGAVPACVTAIIQTSCGLVGCHAPSGQKPDLVSPGVVTRLLNQASTGTLCMNRKYIAGDGTASLLADKLGDPPPCGSKMPLTGALTADQKMCMTTWVLSFRGATSQAGAK